MTVVRWDEQTRASLAQILPEAVVILPIGATEQHGPHLATGTDTLMAHTVVERAAARAVEREGGCPRTLVIAPTIPVGASDHHLPFGGTLSLAPETLHALLLDVARSLAACGGRRLVIVNGHGGNHGVAHAAGAAASNRYELAVATTDYWRLLPPGDQPLHANSAWPGHAGEFETSLALAIRPDLVAGREPRPGARAASTVDGFDLHSKASWAGIEGYTDDPARARAETGTALLSSVVEALADRLVELATTLHPTPG